MWEATSTLKSLPKGFQTQLKLGFHSMWPRTSVAYAIWILSNTVLGSKSSHFSYNFHILVCITIHLQFFKDVLSIFHVFDNRQTCILATSCFCFDRFFINLSTPCPQPQTMAKKELPMPSQTSCRSHPEHTEQSPESHLGGGKGGGAWRFCPSKICGLQLCEQPVNGTRNGSRAQCKTCTASTGRVLRTKDIMSNFGIQKQREDHASDRTRYHGSATPHLNKAAAL